MYKIPLIALLLLPISVSAQDIDKYFESIRNNNAELTAFFSQMPKGGDLHNHYSGSVYAETYIDYVVGRDYIINGNTLEVRASFPNDTTGWFHFSALDNNGLAIYKQKLIQKWSVKDYNGVSYPSDKQFFETFNGFGIANDTITRLAVGLLELKHRAQKEHVNYIETMFTSIPCAANRAPDAEFNTQFEDAQAGHDVAKVTATMDKLWKLEQTRNIKAYADAFNDTVVTRLHNELKIDDATFTMRYQNYVVRVIPPADVFKALIVAFQSASTCPLVVGVNIVAPENNDVSMHDYWLHMQMFRYCHKLFPNVKYAMHAGELVLGMVKPEELTWHINEAVRVAGANRIGHGVDIAHEDSCYKLLEYMAHNDIPVEINLYSNEFILKVKDDQHPMTLYNEFKVPIVISSDDAGVLRSNLTDQFVLLAKRYKNISYKEIKQFVYNSIRYSFIKEQGVKDNITKQLDTEFSKFERETLVAHPKF